VALLGERQTYVAGRWVGGDDALAVENPADETHVADVSITPIAEIERAVLEARRSFDAGVWADLPVDERARILHVFIDHVASRKDELVATMMAEAGQLRMYAEFAQLGSGVAQGLRFGERDHASEAQMKSEIERWRGAGRVSD